MYPHLDRFISIISFFFSRSIIQCVHSLSIWTVLYYVPQAASAEAAFVLLAGKQAAEKYLKHSVDSNTESEPLDEIANVIQNKMGHEEISETDARILVKVIHECFITKYRQNRLDWIARVQWNPIKPTLAEFYADLCKVK